MIIDFWGNVKNDSSFSPVIVRKIQMSRLYLTEPLILSAEDNYKTYALMNI